MVFIMIWMKMNLVMIMKIYCGGRLCCPEVRMMLIMNNGEHEDDDDELEQIMRLCCAQVKIILIFFQIKIMIINEDFNT